MTIREYSTNELITELEARGFTVLDAEQREEVNDSITDAETFETLVEAIAATLKTGDNVLAMKLVCALIYCVTGEIFRADPEEQAA